tara:strand:- start:3071 stop:4096 length:1026 start_codon:yes stop_codon:yes gene_type:complete
MSVFQNFDIANDVKTGQISIVSSGMWSGGVGTLQAFFTSSTQTGSSGAHYFDIFNGEVGTDATASVQFSVAFGDFHGSGSLTGDNDPASSKAIYRQLRNLLLPQGTSKFFTTEGGTDTDTNTIFAVSLNRGRLKEKMDPGNWELHLTGSDGRIHKLIDDSGATNDPNVRNTVREFNIVSGSIASGTEVIGGATTQSFGKFYPESGILILDAVKLCTGASGGGIAMAGYNTGSNVNGNNNIAFFNTLTGGKYFAARREEQIKSTHYFCRVRHNQYNHSQNPTYTTGSAGDLTIASFRNDPKSYITTVGLYNAANELLAVAKLSKPVLKSSSREALIKVRLDF